MAAGTTQIEGKNLFLAIKVGAAPILVGCANAISEKYSSEVTETMCDADALAKSKTPGVRDSKVSVKGLSKKYASGAEATANFGYENFRAAQIAGTLLEVFIGAAFIATSVVDRGMAYVTSVSRTSSTGKPSDYDIELDFDGDVASYTIPA